EAVELLIGEESLADENASQGRRLTVAVGKGSSPLDERLAELIGSDQPPLQQHFAEEKLLAAVIRIQNSCHAPLPPNSELKMTLPFRARRSGARLGPLDSRKTELAEREDAPKLISYALAEEI